MPTVTPNTGIAGAPGSLTKKQLKKTQVLLERQEISLKTELEKLRNNNGNLRTKILEAEARGQVLSERGNTSKVDCLG
jgi:hypothetical protein